MITIHKYEVIFNKAFVINLPKGAQILSCQAQFDRPQLWVLVDTEAEIERRAFGVFGTGHEIPEDKIEKMKFISTFQTDAGNYVFHFFEYVP